MTVMATPASGEGASITQPVLDRVAFARRALAGAEGRMGVVRDALVIEGQNTDRYDQRTLAVVDEVAGLLPGGVLRRGSVVSVEGSTSLVLALIARASRDGSWAAIIGLPHIGVVAATRWGIDLSRLALVPHPGAEAATVAAASIDGMDIVVLGPRLALTDPDLRRLAARARERGVAIISASPHPGTHVAFRVIRSEWRGLGSGEGRLRERILTVTRSGRHLGAPDEITIVLDSDGAGRVGGVGSGWVGRSGSSAGREEARRILRLA